MTRLTRAGFQCASLGNGPSNGKRLGTLKNDTSGEKRLVALTKAGYRQESCEEWLMATTRQQQDLMPSMQESTRQYTFMLLHTNTMITQQMAHTTLLFE